MREGVSLLTFVAAALSVGATACSLLVNTAGLTNGGDADGSVDTVTGPSGQGQPGSGVVLGEAGTVTATSEDDASAPITVVDSGSPSGPIDSGHVSTPAPPSDAGPSDASPVDAGHDAAPTTTTSCSQKHARVFATSTQYSGNLGGVSGADTSCNARAVAASLGGSWRAWLSDSKTAAPSHIVPSPGDYVLLDGTVVASSSDALLSGSLSSAISVSELGAITNGQTEVWTGIDVTGAGISAGFCDDGNGNDWASDSATGLTPLIGLTSASDSTWTAAYLQSCNRTNVRLYCFEVCP